MNKCQKSEWISSGIIAVGYLLIYLLQYSGHFTGTALSLILSLLYLIAIPWLAVTYIVRLIKDYLHREESLLHLLLRAVLPVCIYSLDYCIFYAKLGATELVAGTIMLAVLCNAVFFLYYGQSRVMWVSLAMYNAGAWMYFLIAHGSTLSNISVGRYYVELLLPAIAVGYTEYFVRVKKGLISAPVEEPRPRRERKKKQSRAGAVKAKPEAKPVAVKSGEAESKQKLLAYTKKLADEYIERRKLDLTEEEWEELSLTDLAEVFSAYLAKMMFIPHEHKKDEFDENSKAKEKRLINVLVRKVLAADELYVVFSKRTGEPRMFTNVYDAKEGYRVAPPDLMLVTKDFIDILARIHVNDDMEMKLIRNADEDGKAVYNLLGRAFYLNGVCGVRINGGKFSIAREMLINEPDYKDTPKISIPVTNPDLMRWILLMGQMDLKKEPDNGKLYGVFNSFFMSELPKASFLVPMHKNGDFPEPDENGKAVFPKGATLSFALCPGKDGRDSISMYTDWYRLRKVFDESWDGMIMKIGDIIERYDCSINSTDHPAAGVYISRETYELAARKKDGPAEESK